MSTTTTENNQEGHVEPISADFPFESKFVTVLNHKIHYIDVGNEDNDTFLFLHGNPTSSYLWRNIIPHVQTAGSTRCVAVDLIGMGKSEQPDDIEYGFQSAYDHLEAFIKELDLRDIHLVVHDWGSALGFHYAHLHRDNVKSLVMMEAIFKTIGSWDDFPANIRLMFALMRSPFGYVLGNILNIFITTVMPMLTVRKLTQEQQDYYAAPYQTWKSRDPLLAWPRAIPIAKSPPDTYEAVVSYIEYLKETDVPKLILYPNEPTIMTPEDVEWCKENMKNVTTEYVGVGKHYLQEDNPHGIGRAIASWYEKEFK